MYVLWSGKTSPDNFFGRDFVSRKFLISYKYMKFMKRWKLCRCINFFFIFVYIRSSLIFYFMKIIFNFFIDNLCEWLQLFKHEQFFFSISSHKNIIAEFISTLSISKIILKDFSISHREILPSFKHSSFIL